MLNRKMVFRVTKSKSIKDKISFIWCHMIILWWGVVNIRRTKPEVLSYVYLEETKPGGYVLVISGGLNQFDPKVILLENQFCSKVILLENHFCSKVISFAQK